MMQKFIQIILTYGYSAMAGVVFAETGLLVGFFLPGDSLLFMAGLACVPGNAFGKQFLNGGNLNWIELNLWLVPAAIIGDTVGYWIGNKLGAPLYAREKTWLFRKDHLLATKEFYDTHGGKTIVLARFAPFLRTFAPVVAGIAQMPYTHFLIYNVVGGVAWITGMSYLGMILGENETVKKNLDLTLALIIFVSLLPAIIGFLRGRKKKQGLAAQ